MDTYNPDRCPVYASFFGALGCAMATILCCLGASYGTAKSSGAVFGAAILRPESWTRNMLCAVMAQILSIYGLVTSVIISNDLTEKMALFTGFVQLGSGLAVGLCGMAAGFAIGIVGDAGVRANVQQPRLYTAMVLILIFSEVLGLYGLIVSILMLSRSTVGVTKCVY
ncbi:V-ATPase proteolipid subunit C-like domain-containing protein [Diaporthe sp. PMI_573]|nr:V-ATPase proteolipid subunit C-like domain-containing protein [Diaporthaceae sp. PMI_573]